MTFTLPPYGMPCCGHRVSDHTTDAMTFYTSACSCCRSANRLADALVLMADASCPGCGHAPHPLAACYEHVRGGDRCSCQEAMRYSRERPVEDHAVSPGNAEPPVVSS